MATTTACAPKLLPMALISARFFLKEQHRAQRRRVDAHFVRARLEYLLRVARRLDAPAHAERHKQIARRAPHRVEQRLPSLMRRCNVQQHNLVRALFRVPRRLGRRIARIHEIDKLHAFHHAARMHVEAGDDALGQHTVPFACQARKLRRIFSPVSPDFSGWNCTPITLPRSTAAANGSI